MSGSGTTSRSDWNSRSVWRASSDNVMRLSPLSCVSATFPCPRELPPSVVVPAVARSWTCRKLRLVMKFTSRRVGG